MVALRERGYRTLTLADAVARLRAREVFTSPSFVLTFDDGYRSVYTEAFPVLQELGFSATLLIVPGEQSAREMSLPAMQGRPMLSWRELDEMKRHGIDVGSHTLSHPDLTRLSPARAEDEIRRSREIIEDRLGAPAESFAYPFGRYDDACHEIVRRHYACACSTRLGLAGHGSDPHALERVETYYLRAGRSYEWMLSGRFPLYLRVRGVPRRLRQMLAPGPA